MDRRVRKLMHIQPTFDDVEQKYTEGLFKEPGPVLARQAAELVLSQFYIRNYDDEMCNDETDELGSGGDFMETTISTVTSFMPPPPLQLERAPSTFPTVPHILTGPWHHRHLY